MKSIVIIPAIRKNTRKEREYWSQNHCEIQALNCVKYGILTPECAVRSLTVSDSESDDQLFHRVTSQYGESTGNERPQ